MKEFLKSLSDGLVQADDETVILKKLRKTKALNFHKNSIKLAKDYYFGSIDIASNGNGFLQIISSQSQRDLLIEPKHLLSCSKGDIVLAKKYFSKSKRAKAKVILILKRLKSTGIVYTKNIQNRIVGINLENSLTHSLLATQKSLKALPDGSVLKIDFESGAILEVLGILADPKVDEKIVLEMYQKKEFFSKEAENEAKSYGDMVDKSMYPDRLDLTKFSFCTIDPADAKDFDDAIYYDKENLTIYVAIADVSEYVNAFGNIDKEAKSRGFSIYFPHKSIPMLPRELSENICSLKPDEDRLAFCFKIELDENLNVKKETLLNAIINSKKRYCYDEIDEFLANNNAKKDKIDEEILKWLLPLNLIIQKIRTKRLVEAYEFETDEIRVELDENLNLKSTKKETHTASHSLIEDCMLLANKAAARMIEYGVFRNHAEPDFTKIENLLINLEELGLSFKFSSNLPKLIREIQARANSLNIRADVDKLIIKSQKKAVYEPENKGHFGLGFKKYTHFTSPIRRYSDLILHRLLKAKLNNDEKKAAYQLENIDNVCENISFLERESDKVALVYMDRIFARWAEKNINNTYKAIVTDVNKIPILKLDDELKGARLFLLDDDVELLEKILVKITLVDIATAKIYVKISKRLGL